MCIKSEQSSVLESDLVLPLLASVNLADAVLGRFAASWQSTNLSLKSTYSEAV